MFDVHLLNVFCLQLQDKKAAAVPDHEFHGWQKTDLIVLKQNHRQDEKVRRNKACSSRK